MAAAAAAAAAALGQGNICPPSPPPPSQAGQWASSWENSTAVQATQRRGSEGGQGGREGGGESDSKPLPSHIPIRYPAAQMRPARVPVCPLGPLVGYGMPVRRAPASPPPYLCCCARHQRALHTLTTCGSGKESKELYSAGRNNGTNQAAGKGAGRGGAERLVAFVAYRHYNSVI